MSWEPRQLTWAALLGRWVEFARSAVALPDDEEGRAWREAVPDIIGLQAVAMALSEADMLSPSERALGLDRARILVERHVLRLQALFGPGPLPARLQELIEDAEAAVGRAEALDR